MLPGYGLVVEQPARNAEASNEANRIAEIIFVFMGLIKIVLGPGFER
jgi:hypothetical protein